MSTIIEQLAKQAAQDNDAPQRSATGESKGLKFDHRDDDYAKGQDAWAATSRYFKGGSKIDEEPNPFRGKHRGSEKSAEMERPLQSIFVDPFVEAGRKVTTPDPASPTPSPAEPTPGSSFMDKYGPSTWSNWLQSINATDDLATWGASKAPVPAAMASLGGAGLLGAGLGAGMGLGHGAMSGKPVSGTARGLVRGGATGLGAAGGDILRRYMAVKGVPGGNSTAAKLLMPLAGGAAGYLGSGALMGPSEAAVEEEVDDTLDHDLMGKMSYDLLNRYGEKIGQIDSDRVRDGLDTSRAISGTLWCTTELEKIAKLNAMRDEETLNDFQHAFLTRCARDGLSGEQVKTACDRAGERFGEDVGRELTEGFEKTAWLGKAVQFGKSMLPWMSRGAKAAKGGVNPTTARAVTSTAKATVGPSRMSRVGNYFGGTTGRVAQTGAGAGLGGAAGWNAAGEDASLGKRITYGLGGAAGGGLLGRGLGTAYGRTVPQVGREAIGNFGRGLVGRAAKAPEGVYGPVLPNAFKWGQRVRGTGMTGARGALGYNTGQDMAGGPDGEYGWLGGLGGAAAGMAFPRLGKPVQNRLQSALAGNWLGESAEQLTGVEGLSSAGAWGGLIGGKGPKTSANLMKATTPAILAQTGHAFSGLPNGKEAFNSFVDSVGSRAGSAALEQVATEAGFESTEQLRDTIQTGMSMGNLPAQIEGIMDQALGFFGLPVGDMSMWQKAAIMLGGLSLVGGALMGGGTGNTMAALGGLGMLGGFAPMAYNAFMGSGDAPGAGGDGPAGGNLGAEAASASGQAAGMVPQTAGGAAGGGPAGPPAPTVPTTRDELKAQRQATEGTPGSHQPMPPMLQ